MHGFGPVRVRGENKEVVELFVCDAKNPNSFLAPRIPMLFRRIHALFYIVVC
jgi:hypothetical protein